MDDPCNTDNAWREAEVWNIHYHVPDNLDSKIINVSGIPDPDNWFLDIKSVAINCFITFIIDMIYLCLIDWKTLYIIV